MRWAELTLGRSFGVSLDTGEDLIPSLLDFCRSQGVSQGYVPMFIAGMSEAELVGTCEKVVDPFAPVWSSVHLENIEAAGCGTLATDPTTGELTAHIHVSVGLKGQSAVAHTSHLLSAKVLFLTEFLIIEVSSPTMLRLRDASQHDAPLLHYDT